MRKNIHKLFSEKNPKTEPSIIIKEKNAKSKILRTNNSENSFSKLEHSCSKFPSPVFSLSPKEPISDPFSEIHALKKTPSNDFLETKKKLEIPRIDFNEVPTMKCSSRRRRKTPEENIQREESFIPQDPKPTHYRQKKIE